SELSAPPFPRFASGYVVIRLRGSRDSRNFPGLPRSWLAPSSVGTDADARTEHTGIPHGCAGGTSLRGQAGQQALRALHLALYNGQPRDARLMLYSSVAGINRRP